MEDDEKYRRIVDAAHEGIGLMDAEGNVTYLNERLTYMLGCRKEEILGRCLFDFMEHTANGEREQFLAESTQGMRCEHDFRFRRADGSTLWALMTASRISGDDGRFLGALAMVTDITARREVEAALRKSEERYRSLFERVPVGLYRVQSAGSILDCNDALAEMLRFPNREALLATDPRGLFVDDEAFQRWQEGVEREGVVRDYAMQFRCYDGSVIWVDHTASLFRDDQNEPLYYEGSLQDVTACKRAEQALRQGEQFSAALFEHSPIPTIVVDREGRVVRFNYARQDAVGRLPRIGDAMYVDFAAKYEIDMRAELMKCIRTGEAREFPELRYGDRFLATGLAPFSDGAIVVCQDITERRRFEVQLRETTRMEAVGVLAGGVAHDFNNLLQSIVSYTHLLLKQASDPAMRHDLTAIRKQADRGAAVVRQLLGFARRQLLEPRVLDLNQVVENTCKMLRRLIGEDVDLQFAPAADGVMANADPNQIEQVLMNLAVNARDAMPQGGTLTIETANITLDEGDGVERGDLTPGPYVVLAVSDTGCGMDEETAAHVFDPFYTTKEVGKGTGLGLSSVYGIVKQHGGDIAVDSKLGEGTTFRMYLPRADADAQAVPDQVERRPEPRGAATILLVEDEESVRHVAGRVLEGHGYTVLSAASPDEAEEVFSQNAGRIALLVTDVVMPGRNGRVLYERLAAQQPSLKVLYMSGYDEEAVVGRGVSVLGAGFIQKPFNSEDLARKVREVLGD